MLADHFGEPADTAMYKVEQFEKEVKERSSRTPARCACSSSSTSC